MIKLNLFHDLIFEIQRRAMQLSYDDELQDTEKKIFDLRQSIHHLNLYLDEEFIEFF